jgi:hypothetical protein
MAFVVNLGDHGLIPIHNALAVDPYLRHTPIQ